MFSQQQSPMNEWSTTQTYSSQHRDTPKTSVENKAISYNTCRRHDNEDRLKDRKKRRCRLFGILLECCGSCSPFCYGLLLGVLTAGLALAIIMTLWLTSSKQTLTSEELAVQIATLTLAGTTTALTTATTAGTTTATTTATTAGTATATTTTVSTTATTAATTTATTTTASTTATTTTATTTTAPTTATTAATTTATTTTDGTTQTPPCPPVSVSSSSFLHNATTGPTIYTCHAYEWTAPNTSLISLAFEFRNDPSSWYIDDVSVKYGSTEMLVNGDFESGTLAPGWQRTQAMNITGGLYPGNVSNVMPRTGSYSIRDGVLGYIDKISQSFMTTGGHIYIVSYWFKTNALGANQYISVSLS